jgi:glycosyltransferase involved in cell wall biosynthesis
MADSSPTAARAPRISIVTPSLNQARYVAETIESVMAQDYPALEHIVIDGGSRDGTLDILARYPHLRVVSEPDRGQAEAVNKGFRLATGAICGILNSDDSLLPGALRRVAQEIDPAHGRAVVMGRCRFVDERGRALGIEHPCHFESHRRVLEVWKGHAIPQPAVFWAREVWEACGPMDETLRSAWIDYDLFCRFSRSYRFHVVDQVLATYRLHAESKTARASEVARREDAIRISRRHWGPRLSPLHWRLALSLARHRFDRVGRARRLMRRAAERWRGGESLHAVPAAVAGAILAPEVAFFVGAYPLLRARAGGVWRRALGRLAPAARMSPQTVAYLDRADPWEDGWVGPRVAVARTAPPGADVVALKGRVDLSYLAPPQVLTVSVDDRVVGQERVERTGDVAVEIPVPGGLAAGPHVVEVRASGWFVSDVFTGSGDHRPLAWRLGEIELARATSTPGAARRHRASGA